MIPPTTHAATIEIIMMNVWYFTFDFPHFVCMMPKYIRAPPIRQIKLVITPIQSIYTS
jgi:hypothetical protein